mmetsp:Transcript_87366/g.247947  ORF Transcript_87366/g.247947 Transcript_87366/m.247947 type:complete len:179 (-) Transcript_87366:318-854(-)
MALEWQRYQLDFDKTYEPGSAVEARHYEAFQRSLEFVEVQRARGNLSYSVDLNAFSDMLEVELLERFTPFEEYWGSDEERALDLEDFPLMGASNSPEAVDWRTHENSFGRPMTTRVKDQQQVWREGFPTRIMTLHYARRRAVPRRATSKLLTRSPHAIRSVGLAGRSPRPRRLRRRWQ